MFSILQAINNSNIIISNKKHSHIQTIKKALQLLQRQTKYKYKYLIIIDGPETHKKLYEEIKTELQSNKLDKITVIGQEASNNLNINNLDIDFFKSNNEFITSEALNKFENSDILLLSLSDDNLKPVIQKLQRKTQFNTLEVNLNAIKENLNYFRTYLNKETKIMIMVKAFSYGSGCYETANFLEHQKVDYLGVAITDEGVKLRKSGIKLPIVVMNPNEFSLDRLIQYNLEPEIYNIKILKEFNKKVKEHGKNSYPVHIKIDTGMKRLGFCIEDMEILLNNLQKASYLQPISIFSHLVGSSKPDLHEEFTQNQIKKLNFAYEKVQALYQHKLMRHILNSGGIENYPQAQYEMVRLGIGLYGISSKHNVKLKNISTLKSKILQIKNVKKNETIGYERADKVEKDSRIATVPIGYADGYRRSFGNGNGQVSINGQLAPVIGNVCMDTCMINVTDIKASEGDEVIIFGEEIPISTLAEKANTIPYEILSSIPQRIKRVYNTDE